ncbi:MAG: hypothetical protein JW719_13475, partial [Pirellulales bacterium]|nr:hypothetical protein [Pirellulales bacterium]
GIDWLVIAMEYGPRDFILDWADGLMKANPNRKVMVVTHSHLHHDGARMDWATHGASQTGNPHDNDGDGIADNQGFTLLPGGVNDGQEVWTALKDNPNLLFIFNGHHTNPAYPRPNDPYGVGGYLASTADDGHTVHQMIANYQAMASDNGYLRLLEFQADGDVFVRTYSPNKGTYLTAANHQFTITVSELLPIPGDANGDRKVDETDAQALADHWGQGSATWQMGDFDRNGFVNAADASILAAHWGYGTSESSPAPVPEPSAMSMMIIGFVLATYGRSCARGRQ